MALLAGIGTTVRKSPFFKAAMAEGLQCVSVYNHMYIPVHYGDPEAEYVRLTTGVAMWDVGVERQVQIEGNDAGVLVQYLTPRFVGDQKAGRGRYVPLCDYDGLIINDPVLLKFSETKYWLSIADSDVYFWVQAIARERRLSVEVSEPDASPLAIQGPKAIDVAVDLFGSSVREMRHFAFAEKMIGDIPLVLARSGYSKQGGFELYLLDSARGTELWERVKEAGAPYGIGPGAPTLPERVESGLISYGGDMRRQTLPVNPYEMGFGPLIDLSRGHDFVGRAALEKVAAEGPARRRVGFFVEGRPDRLIDPADVVLSGEKVGYISVMCFSPKRQRTIATGLLATAIADDVEGLAVSLPEGLHRLEVTGLPFVT